MEKIPLKIFQKHNIVLIVTVVLLTYCSAGGVKVNDELKVRTMAAIEGASVAVFYEFPDSNEEPAVAFPGSFRKKITDLDELRGLILAGKQNFTGSYAKRCLPVWSAAVVFENGASGGPVTVLFSQQCKLLKIREKNLYLDYDKNAIRLEALFKKMRAQ